MPLTLMDIGVETTVKAIRERIKHASFCKIWVSWRAQR